MSGDGQMIFILPSDGSSPQRITAGLWVTLDVEIYEEGVTERKIRSRDDSHAV